MPAQQYSAPRPVSYAAPASYPVYMQPQQQTRPVFQQPVYQQPTTRSYPVQTVAQAAPAANYNVNTNTVAPVINVNSPAAQSYSYTPASYTYPTPSYQPTYQPNYIQAPVYQNNYQNISCSLSIDQASVQNGQNAYLRWTSSGSVTSANLSDGIGSVAVNGVLAVHPESSRTYVLTVYGYNGQSATCNTYLNVSGTPYVSLTQIPYTGFDFGEFGNTIYWAVLALFALAASYLMVYYRGGMALFATAGAKTARSARSFVPPQSSAAARAKPTPVAAVAPVTAQPAPSVLTEMLPIPMSARSTEDIMKIIQSSGNETPRIVVARG
jgi:hypothetical protein